MTGSERRTNIIEQIKSSTSPVSGKALADFFHVSRQVIVQDIALIRASGYDILSTNRGYILNAPLCYSRLFKVQHSDEALEHELNSIVDLGGTIVNVFVNHHVYGKIEADLNIRSRRQVLSFVADIKSGKSSPLKNITSNYHYHKVEADSEETLDMIEHMLKDHGYLVEAKS